MTLNIYFKSDTTSYTVVSTYFTIHHLTSRLYICNIILCHTLPYIRPFYLPRIQIHLQMQPAFATAVLFYFGRPRLVFFTYRCIFVSTRPPPSYPFSVSCSAYLVDSIHCFLSFAWPLAIFGHFSSIPGDQ